MASRRHSREQTQKTRQTLIKAALELSAENGFASLSLRSVAREAGIAPTSFYRHFRDMDELGLELVDEVELVLNEYLDKIRNSIEEHTLPSARDAFSDYQQVVKIFIEHFLDGVSDNLHLFHFFFQVRVGSLAVLRGAVNRILGELTRDYTIHLLNLTENETTRNLIPTISETFLELIIKAGLEILDQDYDKANTVGRILEKTELLFLGALSKQAQ